MATLDAQRCQAVWQRVIADEELCRAVLTGEHASLAGSRGLDATDLAILDELAAQPGTRWNVANLRFRGAMDTLVKLKLWMPLTSALLTAGRDDWLQDVCYEYLAFHRWQDLGHRHLAECRRFAAYVRERVAARRALPGHLETVLRYETAVCDLLARTRDLDETRWRHHDGPVDEAAVVRGRPRPGPAMTVLDLPEDIAEWIRTGDPLTGTPGPESLRLLVFVPSLRELPSIERLTEDAGEVFLRCAGERTGGEIARELAGERGWPPGEVLGLVRRWVEARALVLDRR